MTESQSYRHYIQNAAPASGAAAGGGAASNRSLLPLFEREDSNRFSFGPSQFTPIAIAAVLVRRRHYWLVKLWLSQASTGSKH